MGRFVIKALIIGAICFLGVAGGIFFGTSVTGLSSFKMKPDSLVNTSYMEVDETFPDFVLLELGAQDSTKVSELVSENPTLLVFVSSGCGACKKMASFWRKKIVAELNSEIRIALVYDERELPGQERSLDGTTLFSIVA